MFDIQVFGYDTGQVDIAINELNTQIRAQKSDLKYLKKENAKLKKMLENTSESQM